VIKGKDLLLDNMNRFLGQLDELGLAVTKRAALKLIEIRDELDKSADTKMTDAQAVRLRVVMHELRPTLLAEAGGMIGYIISERRFPIEYLLDHIDRMSAVKVFESLPEMAKHDFVEAGKCLAFERSTAAAFHMLRATESTLSNYYCVKIRRKRSDLMWGPMIQCMRSMPKRFPEILLNHLDHIRDGFRNPTAHLEKTFDIDEAQDLFSICADVFNRMIQDSSA
jgi:hypothetical protein